MVANGTSDKPDYTPFKWFYGDVYGYFAHKHIVVDLYADYQRLNWITTWHHSRQMLKGFIAWNSSATDKSMNPGTGYTIGIEGFVNNLKNDNIETLTAGGADTLSTAPSGISFYVHGDIITNKLRFFIRYDMYNPNNKVNTNTSTNPTQEIPATTMTIRSILFIIIMQLLLLLPTQRQATRPTNNNFLLPVWILNRPPVCILCRMSGITVIHHNLYQIKTMIWF